MGGNWQLATLHLVAVAEAEAEARVECAASRFHNCFLLLLLWQETR